MVVSDGARPPGSGLFLVVTGPMAVNVLLRPQLGFLTEAGWDVHVVSAPGPISREVVDGVHAYHPIPMARAVSPWRDVRSVVSMTRLMRAQRPVVVIGSTPKGALVGMVSAWLARVPVRVFQVRGAPWEGGSGGRAVLTRFADRVAAWAATDVVAVSPSLAELLVSAGVVHEPPRVLLHGGSKGVDTRVFTPDPGRVYVPEAPVLGFAGRLSVDKGISELLDVADAVRRVIPGLALHVVGDVDEAQPISEDVVDRLSTSSSVVWRRAVSLDDMPSLIREWDLLVFPSQREGLPNVVLEAAACGVPAVAWDVTGVRDCVDDPRTGRLVQRGDVAAMADAVLECLAPDRLSEMRTAAMVGVRERFDSRLVAEALVAYLDEVRDRASRRAN